MGLTWWLIPVIQALWEAKSGESPKVQEFETSLANMAKTLSLLKIQKLARHGGACLWSQLLGRLRQNCLNLEGGGCSEPRYTTVVQPG